jgi:hypothetical protein
LRDYRGRTLDYPPPWWFVRQLRPRREPIEPLA